MIEDYPTLLSTEEQDKMDISLVIDRMGQLVLGVKDLFDEEASESGRISCDQAFKITKSLGLRGPFADDIEKCLNRSVSEDYTLDFSSFVDIYARHCGLATKLVLKYPRLDGDIDPNIILPMWVPLSTGRWIEVICS